MKGRGTFFAAAAATAACGSGLVTAAESSRPLTCLDGSGKPQDSWLELKYPFGWEHAHMNPSHPLAKASDALDSDSSALTVTLNQFYQNHKGLTYAMWNDEIPHRGEVGFPTAHAKGIVAFNGVSGIFIQHSLPNFPGNTTTGRPDYETSSSRFGQHFKCITIAKAGFDVVSKLALVSRYVVYDTADNANMGSPFVDWAIHKEYSSMESLVTTLMSAGGQEHTVFAKNAYWENDLYEGLIASHFGVGLQTETWQNGRGKIGSSCTGQGGFDYDVENIESVKLPGKEFKETEDHSKWAISITGDIFCVGDINRQEGQYRRGGGAICEQSAWVVRNMRPVVGTVDTCGQHESPFYIV